MGTAPHLRLTSLGGSNGSTHGSVLSAAGRALMPSVMALSRQVALICKTARDIREQAACTVRVAARLWSPA